MRGMSEHRSETTRQTMVCDCLRCRKRRVDGLVERLADQSLSTALRHAQDPWEHLAHEAGHKSTTILPPISPALRWSAPISVSDLDNDRPAAAPFAEPGKLRLYRITRDGRNVYFGIVHAPGQSVSKRIKSHLQNTGWTAAQRRRSESKQLAQRLQDKKKTTFVRYANIDAPPRYRKDPKYLHAIELLAQSALRPQIYIPQNLTFEDEDDAEWS
jgi:hypothetical protein